MSTEKTGQRVSAILHRLMLGLFYPAVLGTLFYSFLPLLHQFRLIPANLSAFLVFLALLLHFCVDYFYTELTMRYSPMTFVADLVFLFLVYLAAQDVNYLDGPVNIRSVALVMAIVYGIFVVWDSRIRASESYYRGLITFEVISFILFLTFWIIDAPVLFIVVTIISCSCLLFYFGTKAWRSVRDGRLPYDHPCTRSRGDEVC